MKRTKITADAGEKSIYRAEYRRLIEVIKQERATKGLTQAELGMMIGQDQTFISKIESKERRLDIIETIDICRALELPVSELITTISEAANG